MNFLIYFGMITTIYLLFCLCQKYIEYYDISFSSISLSSHKKDPNLERLRKKLIKVHPAFKDLELYKGEKSYTINKQKVFICTKDQNNEYYDDNMLIYVLLHEMAHVLNDTIGHTEEFFKKFDELKSKAIKLKIYNPNLPIDPNYCEF